MLGKTRPSLERAIKRLVAAEVAASWIGARHPSEQLEIREELMVAKQNMERVLDRVAPKPGNTKG